MDGPPITDEQLAALPPEFQAIVRSVMSYYEGRIAKLEGRLVQLEGELAAAKKNPRNSSKPPSTEHPHAKPAPENPSRNASKAGNRVTISTSAN